MIDYRGNDEERNMAILKDVSAMLDDFEEGEPRENLDGSFSPTTINGITTNRMFAAYDCNIIYRYIHRILRIISSLGTINHILIRDTGRIDELEKKVAELESRLEEKGK